AGAAAWTPARPGGPGGGRQQQLGPDEPAVRGLRRTVRVAALECALPGVEHRDGAVAVGVSRVARAGRRLPARQRDRLDVASIHEAVAVDVAAGNGSCAGCVGDGQLVVEGTIEVVAGEPRAAEAAHGQPPAPAL